MATTASPRVELYVRSLASRTGRQERVIETLRRLEAAGDIDEFGVHIWGREVRLSTTAVDTACGRDVLDSVEEFESWADANGVSVELFYPMETVDSTLAGERYTAVSLPVMAMAEFVEGDLCHVTPHEDDRVRTVADRLDTLEENAKIAGETPSAPVA